MKFFKNIFPEKDILRVKIRSNVIQYDEMGYPLRLCIMSDSHQMWVDTNEREGDVVLHWKENKHNE